MAASTNVHGWNVGGNNNSFDQRGHFYRAFLDGNVSGMLVKQNSTPNMTVLVEHGSALLNKNTTSASIAEIKSNTSVTIDTANTSNPRIDTVVIYEDTSVAIPTVEASYWQDGAGGRFKIVSLPGTAAASPVALSDATIQTTIGAGKPWARLANITVPTNSTTIINSNINNSVRAKLGVTLPNINGGTTAGVLATNTSGVVSVRKSLAFLGINTKTSTSGVIPITWTAYATVTATTSGGNIILSCKTNIADGNSGATRTGYIRLTVDGNPVAGSQIQYLTPNSLNDKPALDIDVNVTAGSHTFALEAIANTGSATLMQQASLVVQEVVG